MYHRQNSALRRFQLKKKRTTAEDLLPEGLQMFVQSVLTANPFWLGNNRCGFDRGAVGTLTEKY